MTENLSLRKKVFLVTELKVVLIFYLGTLTLAGRPAQTALLRPSGCCMHRMGAISDRVRGFRSLRALKPPQTPPPGLKRRARDGKPLVT